MKAGVFEELLMREAFPQSPASRCTSLTSHGPQKLCRKDACHELCTVVVNSKPHIPLSVSAENIQQAAVCLHHRLVVHVWVRMRRCGASAQSDRAAYIREHSGRRESVPAGGDFSCHDVNGCGTVFKIAAVAP